MVKRKLLFLMIAMLVTLGIFASQPGKALAVCNRDCATDYAISFPIW